MKKFIDENIKANEEAIIRENNGPELVVKLYDNTGIDWLFHYGKSKSANAILIDDTILQNLLDKATSKVVARNASSKIYDIRIKNAVGGESLNLVVETIGRYRLGDNKNSNLILGINDKFYKNEEVTDKYFVLRAHNQRYLSEEKLVELVHKKPLTYLRKNIEDFIEDNTIIYFTSEAMKKAYREDVFTTAKLVDGSVERDIFKLKKEDISEVEFKDKIYKKTYTFTQDPGGQYWVLNSIIDFYAGMQKEVYKPNTNEFTTTTIIDCVENVYENI